MLAAYDFHWDAEEGGGGDRVQTGSHRIFVLLCNEQWAKRQEVIQRLGWASSCTTRRLSLGSLDEEQSGSSSGPKKSPISAPS